MNFLFVFECSSGGDGGGATVLWDYASSPLKVKSDLGAKFSLSHL